MYKDFFSVLGNPCSLLICKGKIFNWMHLPFNFIYSIVCRMFVRTNNYPLVVPNQPNHSNGSQKVNNLFTFQFYKIIACAISVYRQILICTYIQYSLQHPHFDSPYPLHHYISQIEFKLNNNRNWSKVK